MAVRGRAQRVVFVRTGWMVHYDYVREPHAPIGGGSWNIENVGSEVNNFRKHRGQLYGFAQTGPSAAGFNLPRIDPRASADAVDDVLVLIYATVPALRGQRLVGWYRRARCHAEVQEARPGGMYGVWNFEAGARDAVLLPLSHRTLVAPARGDGGFGQSNVRYAFSADGTRELLPWMKDAIQFAVAYRGPSLLRGAPPGELPDDSESDGAGQGWQQDPVLRKLIEAHAMKVAEKFFRSRGYQVDAEVHRYQPYDLLCTDPRTGRLLRVEVKGTTGNAASILLTAGEVRSARTTRPPTALFVVSEITLAGGRGGPRARGGRAGWLPRWTPSERHLSPTHYVYKLPRLQPA